LLPSARGLHPPQPIRAGRALRRQLRVAQRVCHRDAPLERHQHERLHARIDRFLVVLRRPVEKPARQSAASLRRDVPGEIGVDGPDVVVLRFQIGEVAGVSVPVVLAAQPPQGIGRHSVHPSVGGRGLPHVVERLGQHGLRTEHAISDITSACMSPIHTAGSR
jgi:hypothetical protein